MEQRLHTAGLNQRVAVAVEKGSVQLRQQGAATAAELSNKPTTNKFRGDAFKGELRFASLSTFYSGLTGLVGDPAPSSTAQTAQASSTAAAAAASNGRRRAGGVLGMCGETLPASLYRKKHDAFILP